MNIFNVVLAAIRRKCVLANVPCNDCIEYIKAETEAQYHEHLDFYLDFLQDLGLIKYNVNEKVISLTERGQATETLFK